MRARRRRRRSCWARASWVALGSSGTRSAAGATGSSRTWTRRWTARSTWRHRGAGPRVAGPGSRCPTPVWGRDELDTGDMWNSNSLVAWLLTRVGLRGEQTCHPRAAGGRRDGTPASGRTAAAGVGQHPDPGGTRGVVVAVTGAARTVAALGIVGYACLQWLGRTYGSTRQERRRSMPGDDLVRCPQTVATHAVTIPGASRPGVAVARAGGLAPGRLVHGAVGGRAAVPGQRTERRPGPGARTSTSRSATSSLTVPRRLSAGSSSGKSGQGPVWCCSRPATYLCSWRVRGLAGISWTWAFVLTPVETRSGPGTRLVFRWRARTSPWWLTAGANVFVIPADFVMSRDMLRGLRRRATDARATSGRSPCGPSMRSPHPSRRVLTAPAQLSPSGPRAEGLPTSGPSALFGRFLAKRLEARTASTRSSHDPARRF